MSHYSAMHTVHVLHRWTFRRLLLQLKQQGECSSRAHPQGIIMTLWLFIQY